MKRDFEILTTSASAAPGGVSRPMEYFPVGLFGSVMGLTGLSVAWHLAHLRFGFTDKLSIGIAVLAVVAFIAVSLGYLVKCFTAPQNVLTEFNHPVAGNLFGTITISLLLLPIVIAPASMALARVLWVVGAVGMTGFAWLVVDRWMTHRQQVAHATPPWIIPVVGMLDVPLAIPALGFESLHGVMVLGLAVGLFFAVPLFAMIFSRLLFEAPLPDALQPSLLVLLAPFAVGTSAYIATTGHVDLFAESLFVLTLFLLAVLVGRLRHMLVCCPFRVSWWAVSFPIAASSIASLRIAAGESNEMVDVLAICLLVAATAAIGLLLLRTLWGVARGELKTLST